MSTSSRRQRIALVTGANKGIGFEVARQLLRENFRVFLGTRSEKAAKAAADKLNKEAEKDSDLVTRHRSPVTFLKIDISKPESIRAAAEEFGKQSDHLDALINNAGILLDDDKEILNCSEKIFETTLRTNTLGALLVSQAFVPFLDKSEVPGIVNVSRGGGQLKGGAEGLSQHIFDS